MTRLAVINPEKMQAEIDGLQSQLEALEQVECRYCGITPEVAVSRDRLECYDGEFHTFGRFLPVEVTGG